MKYIYFFAIGLLPICAVGQNVRTLDGGMVSDGLGIDSDGNVYGSHFGGDTVYKIDTDGEITTFATGFTNPNGIGVNASDTIYICDYGGGSIYLFDTDANPLDTITGLVTPTGIKSAPGDDKMFMVQYGLNRANYVYPDGTVEILHTGFPLSGPAGIATIGDTVYIGNFNDRKIIKYYDDELEVICQLPSHPGTFNSVGFITAMDGKIYASHVSGNRIYAVDPVTGEFELYCGNGDLGSENGPLLEATFSRPNGILADPANDRLYVSDALSQKVRVIENATASIVSDKRSDLLLNAYLDSGELFLEMDGLSSGDELVFELINLNGKQVGNKTLIASDSLLKWTENCSNFGEGVYVIRIVRNQEEVLTRKIKL